MVALDWRLGIGENDIDIYIYSASPTNCLLTNQKNGRLSTSSADVTRNHGEMLDVVDFFGCVEAPGFQVFQVMLVKQ